MPHVNRSVDVYAETGQALHYGVMASVLPVYDGACYVVTCNGDHRGQDCSGRADVLIEEGDTWQGFDTAVAFAFNHITEHEEREA